ncbi:hypothetical protein [Cupriavidus oxalaticus]|uniref:Uncharacterized protein n=1 Tax=Cupriavidus oxalaticus TaxID=96344 RepID=A0A976GBE0_9BURK|nr:hypothetical protein [Cupriavidus oxalaticus]QRQ86245.1 hypothetical protein JTE91_23850 [Cupriavidus oxalaticus]QRQ95428.1 hypothetical protein JTE92_18410 [Cupriavidus oxalaticus]WQD84085.1 hypothetical protein U0036_06120 [Cupriavidus oxalaticus]SPC17399.1 conserved hypothetical protein [Cupriavidus oxalaticus]
MAVKMYSSYAAGGGHPVMSGVSGALIALLDACLKDGYGLKTVDSIVVAGGVATLTINAGHSFEIGSTALISGATPIGLNGDKKVLTASTTQVTFDAAGISDQTATGTITAKVSPLGWLKPFSGTNLAAYTSAAPDSYGMYLRVDDTGTIDGRVVGYESMTDVNTGTGAFPTVAQLSGGMYAGKSYQGNSTARNWILVGDERFFYLWVETNALAAGLMWGFGDLLGYNPGDLWGAALCGQNASQVNYTGQYSSECLSYSSNISQYYMPRAAYGQPGALKVQRLGGMFWNTQAASGASQYSASMLKFPNNADNALLITPVYLVVAGQGQRGRLPGFFHTPQDLTVSGINHRDRYSSMPDLPGRIGMMLRHGGPGFAASCYSMLDITGPWR